MMNRKTSKLVDLPVIGKDQLHIDEVLFSTYAYEQKSVLIVGAAQSRPAEGAAEALDAIYDTGDTVKVQDYEKLSAFMHDFCSQLPGRLKRLTQHFGPVSCHLFLAQQFSPSFGIHADPDDVLIYVVEGVKTICTYGHSSELHKRPGTQLVELPCLREEYTLSAGQALFVPHGTLHQAINNEASVMLSFGLERFTLEKL